VRSAWRYRGGAAATRWRRAELVAPGLERTLLAGHCVDQRSFHREDRRRVGDWPRSDRRAAAPGLRMLDVTPICSARAYSPLSLASLASRPSRRIGQGCCDLPVKQPNLPVTPSQSGAGSPGPSRARWKAAASAAIRRRGMANEPLGVRAGRGRGWPLVRCWIGRRIFV